MEKGSMGAKDVKNIILSYDCDYGLIERELRINFENVISGIFNAMASLLRNMDNQNNEDVFLNIMYILEEYVKESKDKKVLEKLAKKIGAFLKSLDSIFSKKEKSKNEQYLNKLIDLQNSCLSKNFVTKSNEKYIFLNYVIFQDKSIGVLSKYLSSHKQYLLNNKMLLHGIFLDVINSYTSLNEDDTSQISYYNKVIDLFLKGEIFKELFSSSNSKYIDILKGSRKKHALELVQRIKEDLYITKDELARLYGVSYHFPEGYETFVYTNSGRVDLTSQLVFTIDDSLDTCLDDGLFIEKNTDGTYNLYIHITDIPSIVPYNSISMKEALKRCETIYLVDDEIPIFERYLSHDICSILPNKLTNSLTLFLHLDSNFSIILADTKIIPSVIKSRYKMSYEKIDKIIKRGGDGSEISNSILLISEAMSHLQKDIINIHSFHKLENIVTGFSTNSSKEHSQSHRIVENSMVLYNVLLFMVCDYFHIEVPWVYRVQSKPTDPVIISVINNINNIDVNNEVIKKIIKDYMITARYSSENIGHYGLGVSGYIRASSPARRSLDALVQYLIYEFYFPNNYSLSDNKYYLWENEVNFWCNYANRKGPENFVFASEYNYRLSRGRILEKR